MSLQRRIAEGSIRVEAFWDHEKVSANGRNLGINLRLIACGGAAEGRANRVPGGGEFRTNRMDWDVFSVGEIFVAFVGFVVL